MKSTVDFEFYKSRGIIEALKKAGFTFVEDAGLRPSNEAPTAVFSPAGKFCGANVTENGELTPYDWGGVSCGGFPAFVECLEAVASKGDWITLITDEDTEYASYAYTHDGEKWVWDKELARLER